MFKMGKLSNHNNIGTCISCWHDDDDVCLVVVIMVSHDMIYHARSCAHTSSYYHFGRMISLIDTVLLPPNLRDLLQITSKVNSHYQTTQFVNVTIGPAQLDSLLHSTASSNNHSAEHNNVQTAPWMLLAPLDRVLVRKDGTNSTIIMQVLDRYSETGWLLHLQSVIRHHFALQQAIPNTSTTALGKYEIRMQSGLDTTIQVQSDGNVVTVDGMEVEPVDDGNAPLHAVNG